MKKILAIGLASAMMTTTAFAANLERKIIEPGTQIKFEMKDFSDKKDIYVGGKKGDDPNTEITDDTKTILPTTYVIGSTTVGGNKPDGTVQKLNSYTDANNYLGAKWGNNYGAAAGQGIAGTFGLSTDKDGLEVAKKKVDMIARQDIQPYDFTAQNFRVELKASVGRNLIKSTTFDGAGNLIVTIRDGFKLPSTAGPDLIVNDLSVTALRDIKAPDGKTVALYKGRKFSVDPTSDAGKQLFPEEGKIVTVGVDPIEVALSGQEEYLQADGKWTKFTADGGSYRGTVKFDDPMTGLTVMGTVYSGDVVSFKYDAAPTDAVIKVLQNNPNAIVEVHNIMAKGFKTGFTVSIPGNMVAGAEADENGNVDVLSVVAANNKKLYMLSNTGVLTAAPFTYNSATGTWQGKLPATGGTLLISDIALQGVTAGGNTGTGNPNTGFGVDFASAIVK